jgi:beta-lactamase superfamily II metal-dependent hydrolase
MQIKIFDVSHGFCACLVADNGNVMLFDCGHNEKTGFRPSTYLQTIGCTTIQNMVLHNFDQDHVSDLPNVLRQFPVQVLYRNSSMTSNQLILSKLQNGEITDQLGAAIQMHQQFIYPVVLPPPFPGIEFICFNNSYPLFSDTNNLSLVAFIHYDGLSVVFPGDLEKAGWEMLLRNPLFRYHLSRVHIFVASHHGRKNGYCADVFKYCQPEIIIISDKEVMYDTQENVYAQQASGIVWDGGPQKRYVLTTRSDGDITITKHPGRVGRVTVDKSSLLAEMLALY